LAEYAVLSAQALKQAVGSWAHQVRLETVVPILAVAFLVWIIWRTFVSSR
jgi:hypothetical protein